MLFCQPCDFNSYIQLNLSIRNSGYNELPCVASSVRSYQYKLRNTTHTFHLCSTPNSSHNQNVPAEEGRGGGGEEEGGKVEGRRGWRRGEEEGRGRMRRRRWKSGRGE